MITRLFALALLLIYPMTACAVDLPAAEQGAGSPGIVAEQRPGSPNLNLGLDPEAAGTLRLAAVERPQAGQGMEKEPARAIETRSEAKRQESTCDFWETHFGGNRWMWWAGAAVILIAIHVVAAD